MPFNEKYLYNQRWSVKRKARDILQDAPLIVDFETTGVNTLAEIIEIAVLEADGTVRWNGRIRPDNDIHPDALAAHGIALHDLKDAPPLAEVWSPLSHLFFGRTLVAYNAAFEQRMLTQAALQVGKDVPAMMSWHCAMLLYAQYHGQWNGGKKGWKWHKLAVACSHMDIPLESAHAALGDCRATLQLLQAMAENPL